MRAIREYAGVRVANAGHIVGHPSNIKGITWNFRTMFINSQIHGLVISDAYVWINEIPTVPI